MSNNLDMSRVTMANAMTLTHGILAEVLGNEASTAVNGVDVTKDDEDAYYAIAIALQAAFSEYLG